jgi:SAM-dependent methyltransferase
MTLPTPHLERTAPSAWLVRWAHLIRPGGTALDVACGQGRHLLELARIGMKVTGVDRSPGAVEQARQLGEGVLADLENEAWPLMDGAKERQFDAVVVTNYLWRPLFPVLVRSLAPGGVLIYETFAAGNETIGKPSRPDFLLQPGELLKVLAELRIVAYEDGYEGDGEDSQPIRPRRFVQRIVAVQSPPGPGADGLPHRYPL